MSIKTGEYLDVKDIYIDYPYEEVMFRRTHKDGLIYKKFYGNPESKNIVKSDNVLYNDALLSGEEITEEQYLAGK